jgi:hypothetical protein
MFGSGKRYARNVKTLESLFDTYGVVHEPVTKETIAAYNGRQVIVTPATPASVMAGAYLLNTPEKQQEFHARFAEIDREIGEELAAEVAALDAAAGHVGRTAVTHA